MTETGEGIALVRIEFRPGGRILVSDGGPPLEIPAGTPVKFDLQPGKPNK